MDPLDYWAIAERDIAIQNPITDRKLWLLDDYCDIRDGLRILDIGCGKAWLLRHWAEHHAIDGTGLEINPHFLEVAERPATRRGRLDFVAGPAAVFSPEPASYDVVLCLGASFALGGLVAAMDWMCAAARPGGAVVIGDITLKHAPTTRDASLPHDALETMAIVERHGAEVAAMISASDADFERYASHHRHATLTWAEAHPEHPDHAEVLRKSREDWTYYLRTVRPHLGWTIFAGRRHDAIQ